MGLLVGLVAATFASAADAGTTFGVANLSSYTANSPSSCNSFFGAGLPIGAYNPLGWLNSYYNYGCTTYQEPDTSYFDGTDMENFLPSPVPYGDQEGVVTSLQVLVPASYPVPSKQGVPAQIVALAFSGAAAEGIPTAVSAVTGTFYLNSSVNSAGHPQQTVRTITINPALPVESQYSGSTYTWSIVALNILDPGAIIPGRTISCSSFSPFPASMMDYYPYPILGLYGPEPGSGYPFKETASQLSGPLAVDHEGRPYNAPSAVEITNTAGSCTQLLVSGQVTALGLDGSGTLTSSASTVVASSKGNKLTFTYTAAKGFAYNGPGGSKQSTAGGLSDGSLTLTVPSGWSVPSTSSTAAGYTTASCATTVPPTCTVAVSGRNITVSGLSLTAGQTVKVIYGAKTGATAPSTTGKQTWVAQEQATLYTPPYAPPFSTTYLNAPPQITVK